MILFLEPWCQIVQGQFKGFVLGSSEYKGGNWVTCLMIVSKWNLFCFLPPYRHHWHKTKTNVSTSLGACKLSAFCVAKDWLTIVRWTLYPAMQPVLVLVKLWKSKLHIVNLPVLTLGGLHAMGTSFLLTQGTLCASNSWRSCLWMWHNCPEQAFIL